MTPEEFLDGFALWEEHKPQYGEDWVAVAWRMHESGTDWSNGSPIFQALMIQTERLAKLGEKP